MNKELVHYIEKLLYSSECVIIPDFGGFVAASKEAQMLENGSIIPRSKQIAFNRILRNNDGILANEIAISEGIPYQEALNLIKNWVAEAENKLEVEKSINIGEIGELSRGAESTILFKPKSDSNFDTASYGLFPVNPSYLIKAIPAVEKISTPIIPLAEENIEEAIVLESIPNEKPEVKIEKAVKSRKPVLAALSLILLLLTAGIIISRYTFFNNTSKSSLNPLNFDTVHADKLVKAAEEKEIKDSILKESETVADSSYFDRIKNIVAENPAIINEESVPVEKENIVEPIKAENPTTITAQDSVYYAIGGAFLQSSNADKFQNLLEKNGFNSDIIIEKNHSLARVSYKKFKSRVEADREIEKLRKTTNPDAWLLALGKKDFEIIQK